MVLRLTESLLVDVGRSLRGGMWINAGSTVKSVARGNGRLEGYIISWGSPQDTDLEGQFFTPQTVLREDYYSDYPMLYHHGLDEQVGLDPIGRIKSIDKDDVGVWVQAQLDMADKYAREVYDMVQTKQFGWSSGAVDHLVKIAPDGEIQQWVLFEGSVTPTPAQPHKTKVSAVKSVFGFNDPVASYLRARSAEAIPQQSDQSIVVDGDDKMASNATKRAVLATLKGTPYRFTAKQIEEIADEVEATMSEDLDDLDDALMSDDLNEFDDAAMSDDLDNVDDALMSDDLDELDDLSVSSYGRRKGRLRGRKAEETADELDDALMSDDLDDLDDALMSDDLDDMDDALMSDDLDDLDDLGDPSVSSYGRGKKRSRVRGRKALDRYIPYDVRRYVARLEARVKSLERMEAPGEGRVGMKGIRVVDQADRKGAYKSAFDQYIRRGEIALSESQRYVLNSRRVVGTETPGFVDPTIKALNITQAGSVGFAVPPDFLNELNQNISVSAAMFNEARKQQTSSDTIVIPDVVTTDARRAFPGSVSWVGESPASQAASQVTDISLAQINLPIFVAMVSTTETYSAMEDVSFDLGAKIAEQFAETLWTQYERLIWAGDGQNKLRGIVNDARVTGVLSAGVSTVGGYVNSGAASTITSGDPLKTMQMHLPPQYRRRAKWYANSNTINVISQLKDGMGRYLWSDGGGLNAGVPSVLLGSPIVYNEFADDISAGSFPLIYADLYNLYMVGQRVEFSLRRFDDSAYAVRDQVLFIGRARVGGMVVKPYAAKVLRIAAS